MNFRGGNDRCVVLKNGTELYNSQTFQKLGIGSLRCILRTIKLCSNIYADLEVCHRDLKFIYKTLRVYSENGN